VVTDRWTAETEADATRALWKHGHLGAPLDDAVMRDEPAAVAFTRGAARAILTALADAGLLLVPGGETRVWVVEYGNYEPTEVFGIYDNEAAAKAHALQFDAPMRVVAWPVASSYDGGGA